MKRVLTSMGSFIVTLLLVSVLLVALKVMVDAAPAALLSDDFEDGNADGWTVQSGDWAVMEEYSAYRVVYTGTSPGSRRAYYGASSAASWTDYAVQARVLVETPTADNRWGMLMARWQDSDNYYYLAFQGDGRLRIRKYIAGSSITMDTVDPDLSKDTWYTLTLEVSGDTTPTLRAYVGDTAVLTVTDETGVPFASGPCALGSYESSSMFDDLVVMDGGVGGTVLLDENFDDGVADDWVVQAGTWEMASNYVYRVDYPAGGSPSSRRSYTGDPSWTDYIVQAKVKIETPIADGRWGMLMTRWQDGDNYYYLAFQGDGRLRIRKYVGGSSTTLDTVDPGLLRDTWYTLAFEVSGATSPTLRAYVDGTAVLTVTDDLTTSTPFLSGQAALGSYQGSVQFDDVVISDLSMLELAVGKAGSGSGSVASDPAGIDCGITCTADFKAGTVVTLTATPDGSDVFAGWMGACSGTGDCVITMAEATDVVAVFSSSSEPTLLVYKDGPGDGAVTSNPAGIDCGDACAAGFTTGISVTLTVVADANSTFTGWSGACSGMGDCIVMMDSIQMVTATFVLGPFDLSVVKAGNGTGTVTSDPAGIDCGATCSEELDAGTVVTLTAVADGDSIFAGWSGGGCSGTGDCVVTIVGDTEVTAEFMALIQPLTVVKTGNGTGTVTSVQAGIDCGATCSADYAYGSVITLTAAADAGSVFAGWSGGGCSGTGACAVTMDDEQTVEASFMSEVQSLSVVKTGSGGGSVASEPAGIDCGATCSADFAFGTTITLTATPNPNASFIGWDGAECSGVGDCVVMLDDTKTVTAAFKFNASLPFTDDFESGLDKWVVADGAWSAVTEAGNTYYHLDYAADTSSSMPQSYAGSPTWTDYSFQAEVRPISGTYAMLVARRQDADNYYLMALRLNNSKIELKRMQSGGSVGLGSVDAGITADTWYTVGFEAEGNELRCYLNGTLVLTATDDVLSWGEVALGTLRADADFDNVLVESLVPMYVLSVGKIGSGSGSVSGEPAGIIDCGETCSANLERGTVVTLTATPDGSDTFAGWMGACSGTGDCVVTMDEAKNVEAVFSSESSPMLIVYKAGTGSGVVTSTPEGINCGDTCAAYFTTSSAEIPVTLVATPNAYSEFTGWEGAGCSGTGDCVVTMDMAKSVTATFAAVSHQLTVNKDGNGMGMVTSDPSGISCGDTCSALMSAVVTLTAVPDASTGSVFAGWEGAGCSGTDVCAVTMDADQTVTATFMIYARYMPMILKAYPIAPADVDPLYVAPGGNDDNAGTMDAPFASLDKALSVAVAGQTIYMRDGVYSMTHTISLTQRGNSVNMYKIWAYEGESPILDFSGMPAGNLSRGFLLQGDYWHIKGLEIRYAQDNGIKIEGNYNIIENCSLHHNQDTGIQIGLGSSSVNPGGNIAAYNQIINCDSYRNFDEGTNGSNADGFACKLHAGKGNSFSGCRAWENADDGWDLFDTDYPVTIDHSWTWHNGDASLFGNPSNWGGNGNGFKVGGNYDNAGHTLSYCIAFDNAYEAGKGFDQNHNMSGITIYNSVAWGNLTNFSFWETPNDGTHHVLQNNISFDPVVAETSIVTDSVQDHNSWTLSVTANITDFLSLDEELAKEARQADGSLPDNDFAHLVSGSDLIDAGVDVGLPYCGTAPDLGPFEVCP